MHLGSAVEFLLMKPEFLARFDIIYLIDMMMRHSGEMFTYRQLARPEPNRSESLLLCYPTVLRWLQATRVFALIQKFIKTEYMTKQVLRGAHRAASSSDYYYWWIIILVVVVVVRLGLYVAGACCPKDGCARHLWHACSPAYLQALTTALSMSTL